MISIRDLSFSYPGKEVFSNLRIEFEDGVVHGVLGINGSGKTTLFNLMYGLLKGKNGGIFLNDKPIAKTQISFLETQNYFYPNMTGAEFINLFKAPGKSFDIHFWKDILKIPLDEYVDNYSTGMKKKLALLAVLKQDRPILLLDEPFNGIDLESGRVLLILIEKLKELGKTVFLTSHIFETLKESCDFIHVLNDGSFEGSYSRSDYSTLESQVLGDLDGNIRSELEKHLKK